MITEIVNKKVIDKLKQVTPRRQKLLDLVEEDEIFQDLGIYGYDFLEVLSWIRQKYRINLEYDLGRYFPSENSIPILRRFSEIFGMARHYESFKVKKLVSDIISVSMCCPS